MFDLLGKMKLKILGNQAISTLISRVIGVGRQLKRLRSISLNLSVKEGRENRGEFTEDVNPHFDCLCCLFKDKLPRDYEDWYQRNLKRYRAEKKKHVKESINLINKCNRVRQGRKLVANSGGYVIEAQNVSKWFASKASGKYLKVLHDINLRIKEGDFVVILGYSGSGKSTLLNVLSGIDRPSNGKVIVAGHNLISLNKRELTLFRKDNLSFIFQNYALFPELTVRENIITGAELQENVYKRLDIDELVEFLGIEDHLDKFPNQLSGGQQQRVAIIKSVIKNPKILFADEPTAAVDGETSKSILKIFCDINRRYKTTIVLITHNPEIARLGNKKIYIENGRVLYCVNQNPVYAENLNLVSFDHEYK